MTRKYILTVDGPAAAGKGSISKAISTDLNLYYLETGLLYRMFAYKMLGKEFDKVQINEVGEELKENIFKFDLQSKSYLYNSEISELASKLAKELLVRKCIEGMQKNFLFSLPDTNRGIILEGRDCGTVIAPNADLKIFLTADVNERASRRFKQLSKKEKNLSYEKIYNDLLNRDARDKNRTLSPLRKAEDAYLVDNTKYTFEETINIVKNIIFSKIPTLKINKKNNHIESGK